MRQLVSRFLDLNISLRSRRFSIPRDQELRCCLFFVFVLKILRFWSQMTPNTSELGVGLPRESFSRNHRSTSFILKYNLSMFEAFFTFYPQMETTKRTARKFWTNLVRQNNYLGGAMRAQKCGHDGQNSCMVNYLGFACNGWYRFLNFARALSRDWSSKLFIW